MQLSTRQKNGITVFELSGKIIGKDGATLRSAVSEVIANSTTAPKLLFDLSNATMMDSSGLGALAGVRVSIAREGGRIGVIIGSKIRNLLVMAKLITVFESFETEAEALQGLSA